MAYNYSGKLPVVGKTCQNFVKRKRSSQRQISPYGQRNWIVKYKPVFYPMSGVKRSS